MKEYVLVSQGIEIFRASNKEEAENLMRDSNEEWEKYREQCAENGEPYADNEVFLFEED